MSITLRPVTKDTWHTIIKLTTDEHQSNWVAPNWYSMLEVFFDELQMSSVGIYHDETPVGYSLYGYDDETNKHWINRFMIDKNYQKRGYGRTALTMIIQSLWDTPDCQQIYLSVMPDNDPARALYADLGFVETGEVIDDELVYRLDRLPQDPS